MKKIYLKLKIKKYDNEYKDDDDDVVFESNMDLNGVEESLKVTWERQLTHIIIPSHVILIVEMKVLATKNIQDKWNV